MKKKFLTITVLTCMLFTPSPSFAEWEEVSASVSGNTFYVDIDRIKRNGGYTYFWELRDYLKPDKFGDLSSKTLIELDCNTPRRHRTLSSTYHTQPMGKGAPSTTDNRTGEWVYDIPTGSVVEEITNFACSR